MGLTDDDVREILRIIDESELDELRIEMAGFRLHVRRGEAPPAAEAEAARAGTRGRARRARATARARGRAARVF
jgi:hypothetical protein